MSERNIIHLAVSRSGHSMVRDNMFSWTKHLPGVTIFNFESVDPNRFYSALQAKIERKNINPDVPITYIIHTRDLLNWWASLLIYRIKNHMGIANSLNNEMMAIWTGLTKEGFGMTNLIESGDKHLCVYDEFITNREHRMAICDAIGGIYDEALLNHVPNAGGGSSFDGFDYQDRGTEMQTDKRYLEMQDTVLDEWYRWTLAKNLDAVQVYGQCFELNPVQKTYLFNQIIDSKYAKQKGNLKGTAHPTKGMRTLIKFTKNSRRRVKSKVE